MSQKSKLDKIKVGDLVQFTTEIHWGGELLREEYGVGVVLEDGEDDAMVDEARILWSKAGTTTWEWKEMLEKIKKE
jgi:hypothetical protein